MSYPTSREFTDSILTVLAATGETIGDGEAPVNATALLESGLPYAVLHSLTAANIDGPHNDINADGWLVYQITSVGASRQQAENTRELCRAAILTGSITATGRHIMGPINVDPQDVLRDDTVQPPVWMAVDLFTIPTTPD